MLYGFVINASPPSIMLFNSSISVLQLVTKMIGTSEKVRICVQREKPLTPGSLMSSMIKCGCVALIRLITSEKSSGAAAS